MQNRPTIAVAAIPKQALLRVSLSNELIDIVINTNNFAHLDSYVPSVRYGILQEIFKILNLRYRNAKKAINENITNDTHYPYYSAWDTALKKREQALAVIMEKFKVFGGKLKKLKNKKPLRELPSLQAQFDIIQQRNAISAKQIIQKIQSTLQQKQTQNNSIVKLNKELRIVSEMLVDAYAHLSPDEIAVLEAEYEVEETAAETNVDNEHVSDNDDVSETSEESVSSSDSSSDDDEVMSVDSEADKKRITALELQVETLRKANRDLQNQLQKEQYSRKHDDNDSDDGNSNNKRQRLQPSLSTHYATMYSSPVIQPATPPHPMTMATNDTVEEDQMIGFNLDSQP